MTKKNTSKFNLSMKWRLSIAIATVAILTAIIIAISVYYLWKEQIRHDVSQQLQKDTRLAAEQVKTTIDNNAKNLSAWAQLEVMTDIYSEDLDKRIANTLNLLKAQYQLPGDLYAINRNNEIIAHSTNDDLLNTDFINMPEVSLMGDTFDHYTLVQKKRIKISTIPGDDHGYLALVTRLEDILSSLKQFNIAFELSDDQHSMLFGSKAVNDNAFQSKLDKILSGYITLIKTTNKSILIRAQEDRKAALSPITDALRLIAIITAVILFPVVLVSIFNATRFLRPLILLQRATEKISITGDLDVEIPIIGRDEIGRLAYQIGQMTNSLKESFRKNKEANKKLSKLATTLEQRVRERTLQLEKALNDLKSTQSKLVHSEKMISLGQLVAGIAHELNNPISFVHVNVPILRDYFKDLVDVIEDVQKYPQSVENVLTKLDEIDFDFIKDDAMNLLDSQSDAAKRIKDIVLSLRNFSRLDEAELKTTNIEENIDNTLNILRYEIKDRIMIHRDYSLNRQVECFPGEFNQVIMNILANGVQAIEGEGNIWINTRNLDDERFQIQIMDDGPGIPKQVISKIFDPFFTTKPVGSGTGLGLSISYGIIKKHHGTIEVKNNIPHGAIFIIELPYLQPANKVQSENNE